MKVVSESVKQLKKETQDKNLSIQELSDKNTKLDKIVHNLDSTVYSYGMLEG